MPRFTKTLAVLVASTTTILTTAARAEAWGAEVSSEAAPAVAPPSYGSLDLPVGLAKDPAFQTPLWRVTDAKARGVPMLTHDYSRSSALNDDDTRLLLHRLDGVYELWTRDGQFLRELPGVAGQHSEPRWVPGEPDTIVHFDGNRLVRLNVETLARTVIAEYPEFDKLGSGGEQDISEDGRHYAAMGWHGDSPDEAFVIDLTNGQISARVDLTKAGSRRPNWVAVTPDNELFVAWNPPQGSGRYHGGELYDASGRFVRQVVNFTGHGDLCRGPDGDAVYVHSNANSPAPYESGHWILSYKLKDGSFTPITQLTWPQVPHVSCRSAGAAEWATVSTYVPADPKASAFEPLDQEIFQVALDGSRRIRRLAHTRSVPMGDYFWQPRVSESRSGRYAVFASNFGKSRTGSPEYVDVYMVSLPSPPPVAIAPAPSGEPAPSGDSEGPSGERELPLSADPGGGCSQAAALGLAPVAMVIGGVLRRRRAKRDLA